MILNEGNTSRKRELTLSVVRGVTCVRKDLIGSLDGKHASEVEVDVREKGHDYGPYQSTVIVLRGLWDNSVVRWGGPYEVTRVELEV